MTLAALRASLALHRRRFKWGQQKLAAWKRTNNRAKIHAWFLYVQREHDLIKRREAQIAQRTAKPTIITSSSHGFTFQWVFGSKGTIFRGTGHYTAGHRVANGEQLVQEAAADHRFHKSKGWGGLSYEVMIADDGTIFLGNPIGRKSAGVANNNTGMVNVCCPGTTGNRMTDAQVRSVEWLLDNWHTGAIPSAWRLPRHARGLTWKGHKEWPGQSTACPGDMLPQYHQIFRR
jgi:predicted nucleic acid-binding Zn ribbon protein